VNRYVTRAEWIDDHCPLLPDLSVSDHQPVKTGLVDRMGNPILRVPTPVGFHRARSKL
jgi:hypothetical protein